ncbi:hypothetical protein HSE3_gp122 [Bacillus phage vB_BceM-HSE3]|nr:hypothetical protein HSE3_gp122 [Bacillus phage vB_BceM-HSE3]
MYKYKHNPELFQQYKDLGHKLIMLGQRVSMTNGIIGNDLEITQEQLNTFSKETINLSNKVVEIAEEVSSELLALKIRTAKYIIDTSTITSEKGDLLKKAKEYFTECTDADPDVMVSVGVLTESQIVDYYIKNNGIQGQ